MNAGRSAGNFESSFVSIATVSEAALIDPAAHPLCEGIEVEPQARPKIHYEQYDTEALVRVIKKFIRDEANQEHSE